MNNEIVKYALKKILNTKTVLFINLYVFFGSFVFSNGNVGQNYFYIFTNCLTSQNFFIIFVFTPFLLLIIRCFNFFYTNNFLILRSGSKKELGTYLLATSIAIVIYYFISSLLCIGISANIVEHTEDMKNQLGYLANDGIVSFVYEIKYFLYLLLVVMLSLLLIMKLKNTKMVLCIMLIIILYLSLGSSVIFGNTVLNISRYINQLGFTKSIGKDIIESIIFYIIIYFLLLLNFFQISKKMKIISGLDDI